MALKLDSIEMQNAARKFVEQHVYANIGSLVEYSIKKSIEDDDAPIRYDELGLDVDPSEWDAGKMNEYLEDELGTTWEAVTGEPWEDDPDAGVDDDDEEDDDDDGSPDDRQLETARDYIRDNATPREPYEWWAISQWLYDRLKEKGEIVIDSGALYIWGRETTGQAILLDYEIQEIVNTWLARRGEG